MTRKRTTLLLLVLVVVATAEVSSAQEIPYSEETPASETPLTDAFARLDAGDVIRVRLHDGRQLEGRFAGQAEGRLFLQDESGPMPLANAEIASLWRRGRSTGKGAVYGAWIGGLSMGAFMALVASYYDDDDDSAVGYFFIGGLVGALGAGTTGALIGAAVPRWRLLWGDGATSPAPLETTTSPRESARGTGMGLLSATFGPTRAAGGGDGDALMWSASLTSTWGRHLRHGLEYMETGAMTPRLTYEPFHPIENYERKIRAFGYRMEVNPAEPRPGRPEPFALLGIGVYDWVDSYLGVSYGLGLRWRETSGRLGLLVEVRRHDNIQNLSESAPAHETALIGMSVGW